MKCKKKRINSAKFSLFSNNYFNGCRARPVAQKFHLFFIHCLFYYAIKFSIYCSRKSNFRKVMLLFIDVLKISISLEYFRGNSLLSENFFSCEFHFQKIIRYCYAPSSEFLVFLHLLLAITSYFENVHC